MSIVSINPATGEVVREYPVIEPAECLAILDKTDQAYREWRILSVADRLAPFNALAELLEGGLENHAALITRENGKPIRESRQEIQDCADLARYVADHAQEYLQSQPLESRWSSSHVENHPLGIILGIMPWNFPFLQPLRVALTGLAAGNGFLLKPASSTPDCALTLEALLRQAGFPENLFRALLTQSESLSLALVHPAVQGVAFTGSTRVGKTVAAQAASQLKQCQLELGGSDPAIILEDADLDQAMEGILQGKLIYGGQHCICPKRILIQDSVYEETIERLVAAFQSVQPADPTQETTRLGPLGLESQRQEVHLQVSESINQGSRILTGGELPRGPGFFYPLTLLDRVEPTMPVSQDEVFGPAAACFRFSDLNEALRISNQSCFGLGASIYTRDPEKAESWACALEAGILFFNGPITFDPRVPFGGIKQSGIGRELGKDGFLSFVNRRAVVHCRN